MRDTGLGKGQTTEHSSFTGAASLSLPFSVSAASRVAPRREGSGRTPRWELGVGTRECRATQGERGYPSLSLPSSLSISVAASASVFLSSFRLSFSPYGGPPDL